MSILRCERRQSKSASEDAYSSIIKVLGSKLNEVQNCADEFQDIVEPITNIEVDLVKMAVANLYGVQTIFKDIQAENYGQLLTTKYHT